MTNPWTDLPTIAPYVIPQDYQFLKNIPWKNEDKARYRFEMYPVPYIGNPKQAEVYLLSLNPGFKINYKEEIINTEFVEQAKNSLTFTSNPPFYFLDSRFSKTDGYKYYYARLRQIIDHVGIEKVSNKIMCVEYFPYHSEVYKHFKSIIPSQEYSFTLVREAMKKNKIIIFQRSKKLWIKEIPELESYPTLQIKSFRSPYITKKNLGDEGFDRIIKALQ